MDWLFGAPLAAACLHIIEEFFLPGGFADWDRRYRPAFARSITTRFPIFGPTIQRLSSSVLKTIGGENNVIALKCRSR